MEQGSKVASSGDGSFATKTAILRAILLARRGEQSQAAKLLDSMSQNTLAQLNRRVLNKENLSSIVKPVYARADRHEKIGASILADIEDQGGEETIKLFVPTHGEQPILMNLRVRPSFRYFDLAQGETTLATLVAPILRPQDTVLGKYRIGSDVNAVIREKPWIHRYSCPRGTYYVFDNPALVVFADNAGKIANWSFFTTPEMPN